MDTSSHPTGRLSRGGLVVTSACLSGYRSQPTAYGPPIHFSIYCIKPVGWMHTSTLHCMRYLYTCKLGVTYTSVFRDYIPCL